MGDDVQQSPYVLIYDHDHDCRTEGGLKSGKYKECPVKIENNVWIGAGSVVSGNIEDDTVFVQKGIP